MQNTLMRFCMFGGSSLQTIINTGFAKGVSGERKTDAGGKLAKKASLQKKSRVLQIWILT